MSAVMEEKTFRGLREVALLGLCACAMYLLISLVTFSNEDAGWTHSGTGQGLKNAGGMAGAWLADFSLSVFGLMAYLFPLMICWLGYLFFIQSQQSGGKLNMILRWTGFFATLLSGTALLYLHLLRVPIELPGSTGGILGQEIGDALVVVLGESGATLMLLASLLAGVTLFTGMSWLKVMDSIGKFTLFVLRMGGLSLWGALQNRYEAAPQNTSRPPEKNKAGNKLKVKIAPTMTKVEKSKREAKESRIDLFDVAEGQLPPLSLLDERDTRVKGISTSAGTRCPRRIGRNVPLGGGNS